jgi:acetylornithine deacetylase/succinyl-diaminopimelate desuccinylase-like protein
MTNTSEPLAYMHKNQDRYLAELKELIRIPSISTNPENKKDIEKTAAWIAEQLKVLGMNNVEIYPTTGHPVVFGEYLNAGSDKPTILIYGHYDVQPPEPLELWETPPFEPTQRGENLYGRGASDMKGQVIASLKSVEAYTQTGELPINIKFIIEGEEEIGSPSLGSFIAEHKELLSCDFALNPDAGMLGAEYPTITYGLRGLAYFEINIQGPQHDLHSGEFGGAVRNIES